MGGGGRTNRSVPQEPRRGNKLKERTPVALSSTSSSTIKMLLAITLRLRRVRVKTTQRIVPEVSCVLGRGESCRVG